MNDLALDLESSARSRFVAWDARLWRAVVDGPAATLAAGLDATVGLAGRPALVSYLRLVCEAIGLGYVFPASAGRDAFLNQALTSLVPRLLPALPVERQTSTLAMLWNLGENLEAAPPWLRRIFLRLFAGLPSLDDLNARVADVERQALTPPVSPGTARRAAWIHLGLEDRRFLPGALHYVAPTVACVHDRSRAGQSQGIWLADEPLPLGPMGCAENPPLTRAPALPPSTDPRLTPAFAVLANAWRTVATLVTSQDVVAWM